MPAMLQRTVRLTLAVHGKEWDALLCTGVSSGRCDGRCSESCRGIRGCGLDFLGSVLGRDGVGCDPCDHRAFRSGCMTKGCRDVRQCPGVMIHGETEVSRFGFIQEDEAMNAEQLRENGAISKAI